MLKKKLLIPNDIINNLRKEIGTIKIEDNTEFIAGSTRNNQNSK